MSRAGISRRTILAIGGIALLVVVCLLALLHLAPVQRRVFEFLTARAQSSAGIVIQATDFRFNLLLGTADLRGLKIQMGSAPETQLRAEIPSIQLRFRSLRLASGIAALRSVRLENPTVQISSVPKESAKSPPTLPAGLDWNSLPDIVIEGGSLHFTDEANSLDLQIQGLQAALKEAHGGRDISVKTREPGLVQIQGTQLPLQEIRLNGRLTGSDLEIAELGVRAGRNHLSAHGRIRDLGHPVADLSLDSQWDLAEVARLTGRDLPLSGKLAVSAEIAGPVGNLAANVAARFDELRVSGLDPLAGAAALRYRYPSHELVLNDLQGRSDLGGFSAAGSLSFQTTGSAGELRADLREVSLSGVASRLGWDLHLGTRLSGPVELAWKNSDYRAATGQAHLTLKPVAPIATVKALPLGGSVILKADERGLRIRASSLSGPGFNMTADLEADRSLDKLGGTLEGEVGNLGTLLEAVHRSWPRQISETPFPIDGSIRFNARLAGSVADPHVVAALESADLNAGSFAGVGADAAVEYQSGILRLAESRLSWRNQVARASGELGWAGKASPSRFELKIDSDKVSLRELSSVWGFGTEIDGQMAVRVTGRGSFEHPHLEASLEGAGLKALREPLGSLHVTAGLDDTRLTLNTLRLEKPQQAGTGLLEGSGTLDWGADTLHLETHGHDLVIESMVLPGPVPIRGSLSLDITADGTVSRPEWLARLGVRQLSVSGRSVGDVSGSVRGTGTTANVDLQLPGYAATLRGKLDLRPPYPASLALDSSALNLSRFNVTLPDGSLVEGLVTAHVEAKGHLTRPAEASAKLSVESLEVGTAKYRLRAQSALDAEWVDQTLLIHPAVLESAEGQWRVEGQLPLNASAGTGQMAIAGVLPLALITHLAPTLRDLDASGVVRVQGSLRGGLREVQPALEITCSGGELRIPGLVTPLTGIAIEAGADSTTLEVRRLEASLGRGSLRARGTLPFQAVTGTDSSSPLRAEIELEGINPATVRESFQALEGSIGLHAVLEAPRVDLRSLRGTISFPELALKGAGTQVEQAEPTRLRLEDGRIAIEHLELRGPRGATLAGTGWVSLVDDRAVDLKVSGGLDAALFSAGRKDFGLAGIIDTKLDINGTLDRPRVVGTADFTDGRFFLADPPLSASALSAHAAFSDQRVTLTGLNGHLNGGTVEIEGSASFSKGILGDLQLSVAAENVFLDYPKGLQTISDLALQVRSEGESILVSGTGDITQGTYKEPVDLPSLEREVGRLPTESQSGSNAIRLDVRLQTDAPLAVDNNLARLEAYADLRLVGTVARPALLGRLELEEGGRVYVSERTFTIERALVDFTSEQKIDPQLDLRAQTRVGDYTIFFNASGGLKDLEASFTADPPANQEQIQSILLTGSPDNTDRISSGLLASRSALSLFGSTVVGGFNMRVRQALGFSDFRIEPSLVSADSDPTARLTLGQNLTPELSLTYSADLSNSNDQIWIVEYDWRRDVVARYLNRSKDTDRAEVRHRIRFGGGPATGDPRRIQRTDATRLESVEIAGNTVFSDGVIRKELKLKPGWKFDIIKAQERVEQLSRFYARQGYLEVAIRQDRSSGSRGLILKLNIEAGPKLSFLFQGTEVPKSLRREVETAWRAGIVDSERLRATTALVRLYLFRQRYCDARVSAESEQDQDPSRKTVAYSIVPGPRYRKSLLEFPGLSPSLAKDLAKILRQHDLEPEIQSDPSSVRSTLLSRMREIGYLSVEVAKPSVSRKQEDATYASVILVQPGPQYRLGEVNFEGNQVVASAELLATLESHPGDLYTPARLDSFVQSLGSLYWRKGYRQATVKALERHDPATAEVRLLFSIQENQPVTLAGIEVEGNVKTSQDFLQRRIPLTKGEVIETDRLDLLRRRLISSGSYNAVDITLAPSTRSVTSPETKPLDLVLRVREPKPFTLQYGLTYDSKREAGLVFDASTRNLPGEGRLLGYRIIADQEQADQRIYFSQPFLGRHDIVTNIDMTSEKSIIDELDILKTGFTVQQLVEFRRKFTFSYGYRIRRTETRSRDPLSVYATLTESADTTSPLFSALTRDTRNNVFDSTQGSYLSQAFEYGPTFLGGNLPYYKYFGQYFRYFGLTRPAPVAFSDERRSRWVLATGVRVGIMDALENRDFSLGDLFFGGGSTSVRGFEQNSLGPKLPDGQPIGGQTVVFLNNELRAPLYKWLDSAFFLDIGNVFARPSDFSLSDLRGSAGFGLRIRNPFVLLRLDYGWKLDRRPGESRGALHFGIGQAF